MKLFMLLVFFCVSYFHAFLNPLYLCIIHVFRFMPHLLYSFKIVVDGNNRGNIEIDTNSNEARVKWASLTLVQAEMFHKASMPFSHRNCNKPIS